MPRIRTHAIPLEIVKAASGPMLDDLAELLGIPGEYLTLQACGDVYIQDGQVAQGDPFVEVFLFERSPEMEKKLAERITTHLQAAGCAHLDVAILHFERSRYFEDGVPFG